MIRITTKSNSTITSPYFELLMFMFLMERETEHKHLKFGSNYGININSLYELLSEEQIVPRKEYLLKFVDWCMDKKIKRITIETTGNNCVHLFFEDKQAAVMFKMRGLNNEPTGIL